MHASPPLCALKLADTRALWELDQRCFPPGIAYSQAEIRSMLRQDGFHRGIERDDAPGEFAAFVLSQRHGHRGHIITLDVGAEYRRRGLGAALLAAAEQYFQAQGTIGMRLEAAVNNRPALQFYTRCGYRVVRPLPGYYAEDLDGLLLHKDWKPAS
ncbi:MAG TPA: GNAT family N-acetyltransferase [Terriglobales bacterium]|nr:GNAT family N-acetyltransferase [Terriglobales bacterium]